MAVNKNALIRYKTLDKCLANPYRKYYIKELIEACNTTLTEYYGIETTVSRRQIFMDMDFMKSDAGYEAPIASIKDGRKVYYRYEDLNFSIQNKPLTQEEQLAIENTIELLSRIKGIAGINTLESIETKLTDVKDNTPHKIIAFEENEFLKGIEYLAPLYNYIKNKQALAISYQPFKSNQIQNLSISPYYLKQYNNRWFLFGWNTADNYLQNLALDRIQSVESILAEFRANHIDFEEYFEDIIGVTNNSDSCIEDVIIQLSDNIIPYITSKPIHGSQKVIDKHLHLKVKLNYELEALILSYAENMKVIEPKILIENLKNRIEKVQEFY